jgi:hypothetical protein
MAISAVLVGTRIEHTWVIPQVSASSPAAQHLHPSLARQQVLSRPSLPPPQDPFAALADLTDSSTQPSLSMLGIKDDDLLF